MCCPFQARYEIENVEGGRGGGCCPLQARYKKRGGCLEEEGEVLYMKGGFATPNPTPPPPSVSTPVQGIHEDNLEWYVTLVVYTHASLKSGIMETEQQSDDQSVYTTDGITYTMPVLIVLLTILRPPKFMPSTHWKSCTHNCLYDVYIDYVVPHYKSHTK